MQVIGKDTASGSRSDGQTSEASVFGATGLWGIQMPGGDAALSEHVQNSRAKVCWYSFLFGWTHSVDYFYILHKN